jgi:hypothetical protein
VTDPTRQVVRRILCEAQGVLTDTEGEPVASTPKEVERFKQWFGKSVAAHDGKPIVYYTGTGEEFEEFDVGYTPHVVAFFTEEREYAAAYGDVVVRAYLRMENPFDIRWMDLHGEAQDDVSGEDWPAVLEGAGLDISDLHLDSAIEPDEVYTFWQLVDESGQSYVSLAGDGNLMDLIADQFDSIIMPFEEHLAGVAGSAVAVFSDGQIWRA